MNAGECRSVYPASGGWPALAQPEEVMMIEQEMTATGSIVNERELTVEELDAVTGGRLPEGFVEAVAFGMMKGIFEAGGVLN
jgi:hypothetical protein